MSASKIQWTDRVWNPVTGCTKVSQGCKNCYAERQALSHQQHPNPKVAHAYRNGFGVTLHLERLAMPLRWRKPCRVFVNSMSDLFHDDIPDGFICRVFAAMANSPLHTFQVLTKRPERMQRFCNRVVPTHNVWLGVSAEDQQTADQRIPLLLQTPAAMRFVSCEPLLGPVDLNSIGALIDKQRFKLTLGEYLDWVIAGGESGPGARPAHPDWFRSLRDQCADSHVPFFFKQWGEWAPNCLCDTRDAHRTTKRPEPGKPGCMFRCGKKRAGNHLDDRQHLEFPAGGRS